MPEWISRFAADRLATLTRHLRIVLISGPRQSGKTSLLKAHLDDVGGSFRSLDEEESLRAARDDPAAFVAYGATPRGIDEVQRGGESLVRAIKLAVDEDSRPGRFVLSGSTRFLSIPTLSESLAGRIAFLDLWPLSMAERTGGPTNMLDRRAHPICWRNRRGPGRTTCGRSWTAGSPKHCASRTLPLAGCGTRAT